MYSTGVAGGKLGKVDLYSINVVDIIRLADLGVTEFEGEGGCWAIRPIDPFPSPTAGTIAVFRCCSIGPHTDFTRLAKN
jgi:hypothetical protein